jgi:hypothetical protein
MIPPYLYSVYYNIINAQQKEEMDSLIEKLYLEEKTSWALLMSHRSDVKERNVLTCKNGCCRWPQDDK